MKKTAQFLLMLFILSGCNTNTPLNKNNPEIKQSNQETSNVKKAFKVIKVGKTPHGIWQSNGFIYNSNIGDGTVSVIDTNSDSIVKTIPFEDGKPGYIKSFHDGKNVLITDTVNGDLLVIDSMKEHKILQKIFVGKSPDKIKISDDDKTVFISLVEEDKIISLKFDSDRSKAPEKKEIKVGNMLDESEHRSLALQDEWIATPNIADNDVSLINLNTGIEKRFKDGNNPSVVNIGSINNRASFLIVGNSSSNTVTIFDINSNDKKTLSDIGLSPTDGVTFEKLNRVFITMAGSNEVSVIDYDKKTLLTKIPVGKRPVHIYIVTNDSHHGLTIKHDDGVSDETTLWVGNDSGDSVTLIDPVTMKVKETISVGKGHHKMAFTNNKAYISNITDNSISVISIN
ncbi:MAG: YncE family protein [Candidatus Sericytochromatia bacterium]